MIKRKASVGGINRVTLSIMGDDYIVTGNDDPEYIRGIGQFVAKRIEALSGGETQGRLSKTQLAILAALQIADDYHRILREHEEIMQLMREAK